MPLKQEGSPYQDGLEIHPTSGSRNDGTYVPEVLVDNSTEHRFNTETTPELPEQPEQNSFNWDDWLQPGIVTGNIESDEDCAMTGPFMSQFNSLDNIPSVEQYAWSLSNVDYGTSAEYTSNVDGLMGSSSQTNGYQPDTTTPVPYDTSFSQADVLLSTATMTPIEMQATSWFQSENIGHELSTSLSEPLETYDNMPNSVANLDSDKGTRKTRKDKGMKRGPHRNKDVNVQNNGTENDGNETRKRKRSPSEDSDGTQVKAERHGRRSRRNWDDLILNEDDTEWNDSARPKWSRKDGHPNIKYRWRLQEQNEKKEKEQEEKDSSGGFPKIKEGVSKLFSFLGTTIAPRKIYSRNKSRSQQGEAPPSDSAAVREGSEPTSSSEQGSQTTKGRTRRHRQNTRQPVSVEMVRSTAPDGWDPYDNDFYSGDDNISDDGIEDRGKALPYKPPRMACRRCNRLKQPCDHKYPSCSLCLKYNQRCRYRDDLTGRQIRPGQLEEVEAAYHHSRQEVKRLKKELEQLEASLGVTERQRKSA